MAGGELKCKVLFFAAAAQAMECREKVITLQVGTTLGDAFDVLKNECKQLAILGPSCALAVDGQLTQKNVKLHDGCTIAILPPVSGG